jgi:hypothetical protein
VRHFNGGPTLTRARLMVIVAVGGLTAVAVATRGGVAAPASTDAVAANTQSCPQGSVAGASRGGVLPECELLGGPETPADINRYDEWMQSRDAAPYGNVPADAYATAVTQRNAIALASANNTAAAWQPVGVNALMASDTSYGPNVDGWGNLAGRTTGFAYDPATPGRYFQSFNNGGVWESTDSGGHWSSIGDGLPTQVIGAIAWSPVNGGTLIAGSGDNATGRYSTEGIGIYYTRNDGHSWNTSNGVPNGILSFRIAVDPSNPSTVYAATSKGLFRSTDAGASFSNVNLPLPNVASDLGTYNCTGDTGSDFRCEFANVVTDVVVRSPDAGGSGGGRVLAVLGWKYGSLGSRNEITNAIDSTIPQAPRNGVYVSSTGAPGSFTFVDPGNTAPSSNGFTPTPLVGRVALGIAHGAAQNHDVVYALVQDAHKLSQSCVDILDMQVTCNPPAPEGINTLGNTFLDGIYVSKDFGATWTRLSDGVALQAPGTGSALSRGTVLGNDGVGPGYQAWYNEWIDPDPTRTDPVTHAPTRLLFGLEEVWENDSGAAPVPQDGSVAPEQFKVVGRYWNSCTGLAADPIAQPCTGTPPTGSTTHPDQHADMLVPDAQGGGVTLVAGNDGGSFIQHTDNVTDFDNLHWGNGVDVSSNTPTGVSGNNIGAHTLLPYAVSVAKDGSVLTGLQDNGAMLIRPDGSEQMVYGGDGFFTAIDPDNPNNQLEEYVGGRVSVSANGGHTYKSKDPSQTNSSFGSTAQFSTPLQEDPQQAAHAMIGSEFIMDTTSAYTNYCFNQSDPACALISTALEWKQDYDLGKDGTAFRSSTAIDLNGANAYAGWCSNCYTNAGAPFNSGMSTNVGGSAAPAIGSGAGWHRATAAGLPHRIITSIRMDPADPNTVYVTLGTYLPRWIPADAQGPHPDAGTGHVFKSTDHGETFTDITGNLPNAPANWSLIHNGQLVVATNVGVFISSNTSGGAYSLLGGNLPVVPVFQMQAQPGNPDVIYAATFGRGVYRYDFNGPNASIAEFPSGAAAGALVLGLSGAWLLRRRKRSAAASVR